MAGTTLLAIDRQRSVLRGQATPHRRYTPYAGFQPDAGPWLAFSDAHLDQASGCYLLGMLARWAGFDAIVSMQISSADGGRLTAGAADGTNLTLLPLPYPLRDDI